MGPALAFGPSTGNHPMTPQMDAIRKVVVSTTPAHARGQNSTGLSGDVDGGERLAMHLASSKALDGGVVHLATAR